LIVGADLTLLSPLQPEALRSYHRYLWLERGVKERGGVAPSLRLSVENLEVILYLLAKTLPSLRVYQEHLGHAR
jgi:hypothetical protein